MKITITTPVATYATTTKALAAARWTHDGEHPRHAICPMSDLYSCRCDEDVLTIQADQNDLADWSSIDATVDATDAAGCAVRLNVSACRDWAADGDSVIYAWLDGGYPCDETSASVEDGDGCALYTPDIERIVGLECEASEIDYEGAADEWIAENTDESTRYWIDDERGFANEWTLYIDPHGRDELTAGDLDGTTCPTVADNLREIDAGLARRLLVAAVMTPEDYRAAHAATKCVAARALD